MACIPFEYALWSERVVTERPANGPRATLQSLGKRSVSRYLSFWYLYMVRQFPRYCLHKLETNLQQHSVDTRLESRDFTWRKCLCLHFFTVVNLSSYLRGCKRVSF